MTHQFNSTTFRPTILREYDIRGIVGETLSTEDAYLLGRSFAVYINAGSSTKQVAVCYDGRLTSPELEMALVKGLVESGVSVVRVNLGPTPMLYFAVEFLQLDAGIMVTGSHNPPEHNGFKLVTSQGALYGKDIQRLGEIAKAGEFVNGEGSLREYDIRAEYTAAVLKGFQGTAHTRELKVAWDAGSGAAGEILEMLTEMLPGEHILLNHQIDGTFPVHHPDPSVAENLAQLIHEVTIEGCHVGLAFDGDGDRVGVVDDKGNILWPDQLMTLFAEEVLSHHPGATIIADVKASQGLFDSIAHAGGKPLMWKTGHSLVKAKMKETKSPFAGEMSGHIFFADRYYGFDDGLYAAVRLVNILANSPNLVLSDWLAALPKWHNTPEIRVACADERKFVVIDEIKALLNAQGAVFSDIDGVRVMEDGGWWLLRASNTQAAIVARAEAKDAATLAHLTAKLEKTLDAFGLSL